MREIILEKKKKAHIKSSETCCINLGKHTRSINTHVKNSNKINIIIRIICSLCKI